MPDQDANSQDTKTYGKAVARLNRLAGLAWLALWSERLWRLLWPPVGVVLLFLSLSWLGVWRLLPGLAHDALLLLFALGFLYSFKGFLSLRRPGLHEALRRIDRDSGLTHGQAETMNDRLAVGRDDPATRALWLMHRQRAAQAIKDMRVGPPNPDMPRHDPYAVRAVLLLMALTSAFIAGPERNERVAAAFRLPVWAGGSGGSEAIASGWIDPPAYTGLPPQVLSFAGGEQQVRAPAGSTLVIRGTADSGIRISAEPPLREAASKPAAHPDTALAQHGYRLDADTEVTVKAGFFRSVALKIAIIPDMPPTVTLSGKITVNHRGSFVLPYTATDDYGVTGVKALIALDPPSRSLAPAPEIALQPPRGKDGGEMRQTADFGDHPWAGLPVILTLVAQDAAGQEGRSAEYRMILPQRPLTDPLARALAEQRSRLVVEPDQTELVSTALEGFLTAPELFNTDAGVYLGLRHARRLLRDIKDEADQLALADWFWAMAVQIEDGTLSEAERDLRAAQERLREAIDRGASQQEIDRLTKDLREAMNRYMQELAAHMAQDRDRNPLTQDSQIVTQDQLSKMLNQIENLMRQGRTAEAQQLLEQLRSIFDNMRAASPDGGKMDPMMQEMMRSMNEANSLLSEQQKLRDETFEQNRKQQLYPDSNGGQDGNQAENGLKGMQPRQEELRKRLEELKRQGRALGLEPDGSLDEAEDAMREAEQALGKRRGGEAVDAQGRAIEALQKGMQNMMNQAQAMAGGSVMTGSGRPQGFQNPLQGKANTRDVREKIQELIEQLRNKLADPARPKDELDYFERLLRQ